MCRQINRLINNPLFRLPLDKVPFLPKDNQEDLEISSKADRLVSCSLHSLAQE